MDKDKAVLSELPSAQRFVRGSEGVGLARVDPIRKRIQWWRWISGLVLLGLLIATGIAAAANPRLDWATVGDFLFSGPVLQGIVVTLEIAVISQLAAIAGGALLALMSQSSNLVARWIATGYIWLFRGVPLIVQIIIWFNLSIIIPRIVLGIPGVFELGSWDTNTVISGFTAALLGLSLNESAYMAEIIRGGILGVSGGQMEAALSLGMTKARAMRLIVLPQTFRIILPPTGNQFIGLLKSSSLVSVVGGGELLTSVQHIYGQNFAVIPLLIVASVWYLVMTSFATVGQHYLEKYVSVGNGKPLTLRARLRRNLNPRRIRS